MAVDITNHLIPYTQVKRMLAKAWDEGYATGQNDYSMESDNPYRDNK